MDWLRIDLNLWFRILLTFNATSLLVIIFLVQKSFVLSHFFPNQDWLKNIPNAISYIFYILIPIAFTWLSLILSSFLGKD